MTIANLGWAVVHSTWQWTLIAGATVLAASLVADRKASLRYGIAAAGLAAMVITFAATLVTAEDLARAGLRYRLLYAFEGAVVMPPIAPRGFMILRVAAVVWLAGVGVGAIRLAAEWRRLRRFRRSAVHAVTDDVASAFAALCAQLRIRRPVQLASSTEAPVPMLLGWTRPLILLPDTALHTLTTEQLRAVLAHELGHVRRRDDVANLVQAIAELFLFYHPGARWLGRRMRTEREYSCDDIAIAATGHARVYARALATIEDTRCGSVLAVAAGSGTLLDRIQRILDQPRALLSARRGIVAFAAAIVAAAGLLAAAINVPPPSAPAGIRMRRPMPPSAQAPRGVVPPGTSR